MSTDPTSSAEDPYMSSATSSTLAAALCPPVAPEGLARSPLTSSTQAVTTSAAIWRAAAKEGAHYLRRLPSRGFPPLTLLADTARWVQLVSDRRPPSWSSPHTVVFSTPIARLRDFTDGATDAVVPTLFLPPQAGHDSCIVDFSPEQSQVRTARAAGLTRLFSLDWVGATPATKDTTIEDYVAVIGRAVEHLGGRVNLVGDCQGGWLATIYAALHPEQINTLTIAGAPIDFRAGQPPIGDWVDTLGANDMAFYKSLVARGGGVLPGKHMLNGFIMLKPESEVEKNLQLFSHLDDPDHVARYREFEDWFKHVQDIPGAFYLWIVQHLFRDNELVSGRLVVGGAQVDLGRIDCPLNLLGGATDHITPPAQVFAAADHVSTPPRDITRATTSGGHLGLFMGGEALREFWPVIFVDVAGRSGTGPASTDEVAAVTAPHDPEISAP
jgi:poly(3-hydroxyalkanoate) synthetase